MKLRENIDYKSLLADTAACRGDVFLKTTEGDSLNLRSELSRFVVMTMVEKKSFMKDAAVECMDPEDEKILAKYCVQ